MLQDKILPQEINHYFENYADSQLTEALNNIIDIKTRQLQSIIDEEVKKYHQDNLNKADLALESCGGRIIHHSPGYFDLPLLLHSFSADQVEAVIRPGHYAGEY